MSSPIRARFEIRDRATDQTLGACSDEASARAEVARLLEEMGWVVGQDPRALLFSMYVVTRVRSGPWVHHVGGESLVKWLAVGTWPNAADTDTVEEPATDAQLKLLAVRQQEARAAVKEVVAIFAVGGILVVAVPGLLVGVQLGLLIGLVVSAIVGFSLLAGIIYLDWSTRKGLVADTRADSVVVKRGPFYVRKQESASTEGDPDREAWYIYFACFADEEIQLRTDEATGEGWLRLGPLRSATVVLFGRSGALLEIRGPNDELLYRDHRYEPVDSLSLCSAATKTVGEAFRSRCGRRGRRPGRRLSASRLPSHPSVTSALEYPWLLSVPCTRTGDIRNGHTFGGRPLTGSIPIPIPTPREFRGLYGYQNGPVFQVRDGPTR